MTFWWRETIFNAYRPKMVKYTLKVLQDFKSVFDHFGFLCIKGTAVDTGEAMPPPHFFVE